MESGQKRDNHTPSCAVCQRRKVKCDRLYPCAACTKSGLDCHFPPPGTHGKRKRRNTAIHVSQDSTASSRNHFFADRPSAASSSIRPPTNEFPSPESTASYGTQTGTARLVSEGSGYRYVNNHLWSAIPSDAHANNTSPSDHRPDATESRTGHGIYEDIAKDEPSSGRSFVFGSGNSSRSAASLVQVSASHVVFLWQTYQSNVDPMMKIAHTPSVQTIVLGQISHPAVSRNELALTMAIYLISIVSLTDEKCLDSLQGTRMVLIKKYREATELALSAADFITTNDMIVLQALVLYLAALRSLGEIPIVWSMLGIAIRVAGTLGLSRDGESFGLSPFDTEMRRRLWWGIVYFDGRMAELVGQDGDLMGNNFDAGPPSNLNDSDLFPTMTRLPNSKRGPSEAIYLQARVLSVTVARSLQSITGPSGTWHRLHDSSMPTAEKLEIMQRIDQRYKDEILETCDPGVPLQYMSINTARAFATKLRLIARIPIVDVDREWEDSNGFSENAFLLSMNLLQTQLDLWLEPSVQQWKWHWQAHFQWYSLVTLLRQTRLRQSGHDTSRAWAMIKKAFEVIVPDLQLGPRKSLLLDGIQALLNAAKKQQDQPGQAVSGDSEQRTAHTATAKESVPAQDVRPYTFSSGHGARPHPALFPSVDASQAVSTPGSYARPTTDNFHDPMLGFDLDAIDWVEFDRLATELCQ
ncbi:hypothetical protein AC578_3725 [Pseudocercospora eumusae]|uniref:Zn(2)-C6 fungal-type domain-containing protein n=1 Tax=Pseudocercospora eumusae TaxID=321146 RepID=A0A139HT81_9PEZI|nr:hypothetical protein AC578_3725 [Pseudocercospora eumusae]